MKVRVSQKKSAVSGRYETKAPHQKGNEGKAFEEEAQGDRNVETEMMNKGLLNLVT